MNKARLRCDLQRKGYAKEIASIRKGKAKSSLRKFKRALFFHGFDSFQDEYLFFLIDFITQHSLLWKAISGGNINKNIYIILSGCINSCLTQVYR